MNFVTDLAINGLCHHIRFDDNDFCAKATIRNGIIYFWMFIVGMDDEADDYAYKIHLGNTTSPNGQTDKIVYEGTAISSVFHLPESRIEDEHGSLPSHMAISQSMADNLSETNSNGKQIMRYKFEIIKKKVSDTVLKKLNSKKSLTFNL